MILVYLLIQIFVVTQTSFTSVVIFVCCLLFVYLFIYFFVCFYCFCWIFVVVVVLLLLFFCTYDIIEKSILV